MNINNFANQLFYAYKTLKKYKKNNSLPRFVVIDNNEKRDATEIVKILVASYICEEQNPLCDDCNNCRAIEQNMFPDFLICETSRTGTQKEVLKKNIDEFLKPAFNKKKYKFLYVENVENTSWKFLGTVAKNIYFVDVTKFIFLSTQNISKINKIIPSAAWIIKIPKISSNEFNRDKIFEELKNKEFNEKDINKLKNQIKYIFNKNTYITQNIYFNSVSATNFLFVVRQYLKFNKFDHLIRKNREQIFLNIEYSLSKINNGINPSMIVDKFLLDNFELY